MLLRPEIPDMTQSPSCAIHLIEKLKSCVEKLPSDVRRRWERNEAKSKVFGRAQLGFRDLVEFVVNESLLAEKILENQRLSDAVSKPSAPTPIKKAVAPSKTFMTKEGEGESTPECEFCEKKGHTFEKCFALAKKDQDFKIDFLMKRGRCYRCLIKGHIVNEEVQ